MIFVQLSSSYKGIHPLVAGSTIQTLSQSKMKQDYKVPGWLDDSYLLRVLQSDFGTAEGIAVIKSHVESATNKGDNYASEMFRITLDFVRNGNQQQKQIILKKDHDNDDVKKIFDDYNLYSTEIEYYRLYRPEFEKILRSATGKSVQLSPRMIFHEDPVFVMEDMSLLNYRTVSRDDRFDLSTAKMVLSKLAHYHAASMVYNQRTGGSLEPLRGRIFDVEDGFLEILLKKFDIVMEDMRSWGEEYAAIIPKLKFIQENYYEIGRRCMVPGEGLGVFIHGDSWLNNILIRFDKDQPVEVLLIDLQICSWASPAYDLLYFIFTSLNEEDYQNRFDELIKHYYDNMASILRALDYAPMPSLMQLHLEIQSKLVHCEYDLCLILNGYWLTNFSPYTALFGGILIKSVIYSETSDTATIESVMADPPAKDATFEKERFRNEIKYLMKFLDDKGALDVQL